MPKVLIGFRWGATWSIPARGDVVDTAAIPDAIASGRLAGAAIDVLAEEPPSPDNPLLVAWRDPSHPAHERLIVNPHSAFTAKRDWSTCGAKVPRHAGAC